MSSKPPIHSTKQKILRADQNGKPYYIYASSSGQEEKPDENIHVLNPDSDSTTDTFVASLETKVIVLSEKPDSPNMTATLDDSDEIGKWLQELDPDATGSVTLDMSCQSIESFSIAFNKPWPLTFSSSSEALLFTFGAPPELVGGDTSGRIPPPGIDESGEMLTFGLDPSKINDVDIKLKDLFTYAGLDGTLKSLPDDFPDLIVTLTAPNQNDSPKRNAVWIVPCSNMQTTIRLQLPMPTFTPLQDLLLGALKGFTLKSTDVVCKKRASQATPEDDQPKDKDDKPEDGDDEPKDKGEVIFNVECSVKAESKEAPVVSMTASVEFVPSGINLIFMFDSEDQLSGILKWLAGLIDDKNIESLVNDILDKEKNDVKLPSDPTLRRMTISLENSKDPKLASFAFDIEESVLFDEASSKPVVFLISYNWTSTEGGSGTLTGKLWNDFDDPTDQDLSPSFETWNTLQPLEQSPVESITLASIIPSQTVTNIPDTLPSEIKNAQIELSQDIFTIKCTVDANPITPGSVPQPYLDKVGLDGSFSWGESDSFTLKVDISAGIQPSEGSDLPTALLTGSLNYDSSKGTWGLKASIEDLYGSTLAEFFDANAKSHVEPLIRQIAVKEATVEYEYTAEDGESKASKFALKGDLVIAKFTLGLDFTYDDTGFTFTATLNPESKEVTVGEVIADILNPGGQIDLPYFASNTKLVGDDKDAFKIDIKKKSGDEEDSVVSSFQFLAQLNFGKLHLEFAQLHSSDWEPTAPSKRLIKVSIDAFPEIEFSIPLIGQLKQPLDELYFLWVQDPPQKAQAGNNSGLTRSDVTQLNGGLGSPIMFKDKIKDPKQKDLLLAAGCHFTVVVHSTTGERLCLLDYEFTKQKDSAVNAVTWPTGKDDRKLKEGDEDDGGPSAQAPYKKVAGPLSISNVGLKYKGKKLAIMFDATFDMGPVSFSLVGFSLSAEFETLDKPPDIQANIEGLAAAFDKPPLTISGTIRHVSSGEMDYFAGGLIVGWVPYEFRAAGFYGMVKPKTDDPFRSIFVFAKLDGPLITFEFAEVTGICGGFGYNTSVRVPTPDEIHEFPFIANGDLSDQENALDVLMKLVDPGPQGWFQPLDKTYWAAVGMKVDAFQMLSIDAVLVVQFGDSIKVGIFAVAAADIPKSEGVRFAHVELGVSAIADLTYGTLKIESQLSPSSFIFTQDCHLTGGSALYYWFDAPHADQSKVGSFVYTLGGYHQAYDVPVGYPNPPRLGISWDLGGGLSISGQAYFAITPKACMAGGHLHASFHAGPIEAWFDAFADLLINYKPFHFNAQAGLAVGVRFHIDIWFIHTSISAEIGAQLYLWGPPLAGRVHVDFWITSFDIDFGSSERGISPVSLEEFYQLVLQSSSASVASASRPLLTEAEEGEKHEVSSPSPRKNEGHNFLPQSGLMNPDAKPEREQNENWIVRAGTFSFIIACKMAIDTFQAGPDHHVVFNGPSVYSKPMQLTSSMSSTLNVKMTKTLEGKVEDADEDWQYSKHLKSMPKGLWAEYDRKYDPQVGGNNIKDLLNSSDASIPLLMGVEVKAPKPQMSQDPFPAFIVADADLQSLTAEKPFPDIQPVNSAWAPAKPLEVEKQYDEVLKYWRSPNGGTDAQNSFVDSLARSYGWDENDKMKDIAGIPDRLSKGFMDTYVAAPMVTVAV
ncbi:uncharacterized protein K452DRAFT_265255 [Aplosporella prunicola CBS 121167]|uniref:DUF6603 domain-containing protein n=1 Tax=Aplosporella prunicola CBS 121167 TaxID=1176127 RepID=A0A6A6BL40_9PEZI|nr:uncharacterized protein K452DRAFT_265255 [Aplosporella prunicola CBS 121167]KAF2144842.1 hypothetical protein K452DRAFT_265255 [Aplosporella prunicola CBS 121167]